MTEPAPLRVCGLRGCGRTIARARGTRVKACDTPGHGLAYRKQAFYDRNPTVEPEGPAEPPLAPPPQRNAWVPPIPAPTGNTGRYARILFWPDTHLPYQDDRAIALAFGVIKHYEPDILVLLGDMLDMSGFSKYPHDQADKRNLLQTELEEWIALAQLLAEATPKAERRAFIRGNHEQRLEKWMFGHPQLSGFSGFNLGSLLRLHELGFDPQAHEEIELCGGELTVKHGVYTGGRFAGLAPRQEMAATGTSGVSGHTHKASQYLQRDKAGLRVWVESGHLTKNPPHYLGGTQNWHQAVTIGEVSRDGNDFDLELIPFRLSYKCRVGGVELSA